MPGDMTAAVQRLFQQNIVWDAHAGFAPSPQVDLTRMQLWKDAGVDYLSINVGYDVMDWRDTLKALAYVRRWLLQAPGYRLVREFADIAKAKAAGELACAFDLEGMNALDGSLDMVELYHSLGVRQMLFAYNRNNLAGGGCHDQDVGLTAFGRAVVGEMNRLGMVVDLSHCAYRTTMEALEFSADPCIFSHSNPRALHDHERNIRDDQAKACAAKGGVIGVNGIGIFLGENDIRTATWAEHVDYLVQLVGPSHVGLGLDYALESEDEGLGALIASKQDYWPKRQYDYARVDCVHPRQIAELAEDLLRRQYREEDVAGILGGNFLRVAKEVWK
jgi:membrane dipeptidase